MADNVAKLKELLFQQESATLADLSKRIETLAEVERQARAELVAAGRLLETATAQRLEQLTQLGAEGRALQDQIDKRLALLSERTGTPEALKSSVAAVIDDVIIEARETKQDELSRALAPMLVKTIKAELKNNQAEMVEALYPITGQLVKAYVASAMKDLTNKMNRGLQANPAMLRVRSLFSGYSMAELALAESQQLEVEELYLIRRGSGELLQRWPGTLGRSNSDIHMSGVITAINDFSSHAFQTDGGQLRSFNLDEFTVFLRASPIYLLAAKCRGVPAPGVDGLIDAEFLEAVTRQHDVKDGGSGAQEGAPPSALLASLKTRLESAITERHEQLARAGMPFDPLRAVVAAAALAVVAGLGWYGWTTYEVESTRAAARNAIEATQAMSGYPVIVDVGDRGQSITLSGLAPSESAKSALLGRLAQQLPGVAVDPKSLAALPIQGPDLTSQMNAVRRDLGGVQSAVKTEIGGVEAALRRQLAELESQAVRNAALRSLERAQRRLDDALPDLATLMALRDSGSRATVAAARAEAEKVIASVRQQTEALHRAATDAGQQARSAGVLAPSAGQLRAAAASLAGLIDPGATAPRPAADPRRAGSGSLPETTEDIALAAERLATVAAAAVHTASIRIPEPTKLPQPTPRERLQAYVAANAVFFANGEDYRDANRAAAVIAEVAKLAREARALVRVVGHTDERGGVSRNSQLAQARADKVAQALVARGLPRELMVSVGRALGPDISPSTGPDSANRRVEFELGFAGEPAAGP